MDFSYTLQVTLLQSRSPLGRVATVDVASLPAEFGHLVCVMSLR